MRLRWFRRRLLVKAAACIIVGAVVNVAVAWACAARPYLTRVRLSTPTAWSPAAAPEIGGENWKLSRRGALGVSRLTYYAHNPTLETAEGEAHFAWCQLTLSRSGLPFRSMEWRFGGCATGMRAGARGPDPEFTGGYRRVQVPWGQKKKVTLPLLPIASGFAANTAVYAAGLWSVLFAPGAIRRWRRVRRGACLACGYNAVGLAGCPECGARARMEAAS